MKLIIAGSRDFNDYNYLTKVMNKCGFEVQEVVCGMARGADLLGKQWADEQGITVKEFPADWNSYGRRAGYIRNEQMAYYATDAIIFWDGKSTGSKHMIGIARKVGLNVYVIEYKKVNDNFN